MATIVLREFAGEVPRLEPYLLEPDAAQLASNCDLTTGSLAPLKGGVLFSTMSSNPVRSIYTRDGLYFFTWTSDTDAYQSPVINDAYDRVYYLTAGGSLRVTTHGVATLNGGPPNQSWLAGVPAPTVAPTLALTTRSTLPDYPSAVFSWKGWYEFAGTRYDETTLATTTILPLREYNFAAPVKGTDTPVSAVLVVQLTITENSKSLLILDSREGQATPSRSTALPGGVELAIRKNATNYTAILTWGVVETRAYVYTCVNTWLEESAPSPATLVSPTYIQDVQVTMAAPSFSDYRPFSGFNVYRTFGTTASYLKVTVNATTANPYLDVARSPTSAFSALASQNWTVAPTGLSGMVAMPNGYFAAYKENAVYFSEPYRPGAWPYSLSFPKAVRGICVGAQSLVVTTPETCYSVFGAHPASLQSQVLPLPQGGIAKRSMTAAEGAVAFASPDGIVLVAGSNASLDFSQKLFTRDKWRDRYGASLNDASLRLAFHDGYLIGTSYARAAGFIVRPHGAGMAYSRYDVQMDSMFWLPSLDTLYYSVGNTIYRFRAGSVLTLDWWSREYIFQKPAGFAVFYVRATGSVTLTFYREGTQFYQVTVPGTGTYRMPPGLTGLRWSVRVQGTSTVNELLVASSMEELKSV